MTDRLTNAYNQLAELDLSNLERTELGVGLSFEKIAEKIRKMQTQLLEIRASFEELDIPENKENSLAEVCENLNTIIKNINSLNGVDNPNAYNERTNILSTWKSLEESYHDRFAHLYNRAMLNKLNPKNLSDLEDERLVQLAEIKKDREEARKILQGIKDASSTAGTVISAENFLDEGVRHKKLAKIWLGIFTFLLVATFFLAYYLFEGKGPFADFKIDDIDDKGPYVILHFTIFKVVILSLAYLILYQVLKNYKNHRHLQVLNTHRQNVLQVYQLMVNSAEGDNKQVVLKEASHAIFDLGGTGYLDDDKTPAPINITGMVNKMDK